MGEFEKRIVEQRDERAYKLLQTPTPYIHRDELLEWVAEAKAEFPAFHRNYWKGGKLITYEDSILVWYNKWFGDE